MLVDTSVWVLAEGRNVDIREYVALPRIATCPPIVMEVLRGVRDHRYAFARELLAAVEMLDIDMPLERFQEAAELYRRCRKAGVTVRKSMDCLIAITAIRYSVGVLHDDSDFELIASVLPQFEQRRINRSASAPNS